MRRRQLQSQTYREKKRRAFRWRFVAIIVLILLLIGGAIWLLRFKELQIDTVTVRGTERIDTEEVEAVIEEKLDETLLWILPASNTFLVDESAITDSVRALSPIIGTVDVAHKGMNELMVTVQEREPVALWCARIFGDNEEKEGECYFIDKGGYIYSEAPDFTGSVFLKIFSPRSGEEIVGSVLRLGVPFGGILAHSAALEERHLHPRELLIDETKARFVVESRSDETKLFDETSIILNLEDTTSSIFKNFDILLREDTQSEFDESGLEYVDLRFGNKLYYKFKKDVAEQEEQSIDTPAEDEVATTTESQ